MALSYQWFRDGSPIDDATESTHILQSPDLGRSVTVAVTGSKPGYTTESRTSLPTDSVAPGTLTDKVPTITGTPTVGNTLTAVPGTWSPAGVDLSYQWSVDGTEIDGATKTTLALEPAHAGKAITVAVTGSKAGYTPATTTSAATAKVATAALTAPVPTITGTPTVGNTLTAVPGTWSPAGVALSYQWFRDGSPIDDATESTQILQSPDLGRSVTVAVTGSKPGYTTESRTSLPTDSVAPGTLTDKVPTITGTPTVGNTLTAVPGTWGPAGVDLSYQWSADGTRSTAPPRPPWTFTPAYAGKADHRGGDRFEGRLRHRAQDQRRDRHSVATWHPDRTRSRRSPAPRPSGTPSPRSRAPGPRPAWTCPTSGPPTAPRSTGPPRPPWTSPRPTPGRRSPWR